MKTLILAIALVALSFAGMAKDINTTQKGFWVVESNVQNTKLNTFKFYNEDKELIYEETVDFEINVSSKKVQKKLNRLLAELVDEWNAKAEKARVYKYLASL